MALQLCQYVTGSPKGAPSPLVDEGAWQILFQYLTTEMTYPQMEEEFLSYLSDRYCADDWKDTRDALFSADDLNDDATPLANLQALYAKHCVPVAPLLSDTAGPLENSPSVATAAKTPGRSSAYTHKSCHRSRQRPREEEEDLGEEEEDSGGEEEGYGSMWSWLITSLPKPSAKQTFLSAVNNIFNKVNTSKSSDRHLPYRAAWSPGMIQSRMYLLHELQQPLSPNTFRTKDSPLPSLPGSQANYSPSESIFVSQTKNVKWLNVHAPNFPTQGDEARVITEQVCLEIGRVVSTNHAFGSVCLEFVFKGHQRQIDFPLWDVERMFWLSDSVRVVAGAYLGLEGYIIQMSNNIFHVYQESTKEELPMQQLLEALPETESLEIGDYVEVLGGQYGGKRGIINWFSPGATSVVYLWVDNLNTWTRMCAPGPVMIEVPSTWVQRMYLTPTIKFTKEKGYDVRPGDFVRVARGLEYQTTGVVQSVDFPMAHLTLLSETNKSLIDVPMRSETCTIPVHGQKWITLKHANVATSILSTWTANPEDINGAVNHLLVINSATSSELTFDPWTVDPEDNGAGQEKIQDNGSLPWLMHKEFYSTFLTHHMVLKVSPSFMGGRLHKRFVSTACPDPFCSMNGPAPENCIAAFCTSNSTGATMQHYHIPVNDLSLAPPHKKNQQCLILDGDHCGVILTIVKCNVKKNTVEVYDMDAVGSGPFTLCFDQICVVEPAQL
ncbi:hypothetical protein EDB19DRAFT_1828733 [Suillus lakei]|nr:hypothetical protein EDB19DRAFT_1828733 [Suillus lakei]